MPKRDNNARRRPVNLSLQKGLVEQAKALGLNVSQIAENALSAEVKRTLEKQWLEENADAIKAFNKRVDEKGMYNEGLRRF